MNAGAVKRRRNREAEERRRSLWLSLVAHGVVLGLLLWLLPREGPTPEKRPRAAVAPRQAERIWEDVEARQARELRRKLEELETLRGELARMRSQREARWESLAPTLAATAGVREDQARQRLDRALAELREALGAEQKLWKPAVLAEGNGTEGASVLGSVYGRWRLGLYEVAAAAESLRDAEGLAGERETGRWEPLRAEATELLGAIEELDQKRGRFGRLLHGVSGANRQLERLRQQHAEARARLEALPTDAPDRRRQQDTRAVEQWRGQIETQQLTVNERQAEMREALAAWNAERETVVERLQSYVVRVGALAREGRKP